MALEWVFGATVTLEERWYLYAKVGRGTGLNWGLLHFGLIVQIP